MALSASLLWQPVGAQHIVPAGTACRAPTSVDSTYLPIKPFSFPGIARWYTLTSYRRFPLISVTKSAITCGLLLWIYQKRNSFFGLLIDNWAYFGNEMLYCSTTEIDFQQPLWAFSLPLTLPNSIITKTHQSASTCRNPKTKGSRWMQWPNGQMFLSAKTTRYAISRSNWSGESTLNYGRPFIKGSWKHVTYTQSGNKGTIYVDGSAVKSGTITKQPAGTRQMV